MLTILVGKSGCGKDTLQEELVKEGFVKLVSTTSRPMREGEVEGREYYFVDNKEFDNRIKNGYFIEYRQYNTINKEGNPDVWYYGLGKQINKEDIKLNNFITILDLQGAKECIDYYGINNCFVTYINLDDKIREERAIKRGGFNKAEWDRRLIDDNKRFSVDNIKEVCNVMLQNDSSVEQLKKTFKYLYEISNPDISIDNIKLVSHEDIDDVLVLD